MKTNVIFSGSVLLISLGLLSPSIAQSWPRAATSNSNQVCTSSLPPPRIRVLEKATSMAYRYDLTASQISAISNGITHGIGNGGSIGKSVHYLGLTEAGLETSALINVSTLTLNGGVQCLSPDVIVNVGFIKMNVYVARELTNYRCAFDHVLSHEMQHVSFNEEALRLTIAKLNVEAQDYLSRGNTLTYGSAELADAYSRELSNKLMVRSKQLFSHYNTRHESIDSPEEYAKNSTICSGIINRVMGSNS